MILWLEVGIFGSSSVFHSAELFSWQFIALRAKTYLSSIKIEENCKLLHKENIFGLLPDLNHLQILLAFPPIANYAHYRFHHLLNSPIRLVGVVTVANMLCQYWKCKKKKQRKFIKINHFESKKYFIISIYRNVSSFEIEK